ncbi:MULTISPECIES: NUDIX domain-containing protein [unclassified Streptomyces]|uniref:NUDIX domain-containing protein n=1 Tax=unclassified Streptomyces TaxID=2593676 RepID=UPI0038008D33
MTNRQKDSHCSYCGAAFGPGAGWPRTCPVCGNVTYRNPLPVAIALLPVRTDGTTGLVVVRRTIEPARGMLGLPGGFVDHGETWQQAVVRELDEETGIKASVDDVRLADALSGDTGHVLLFGLLPERAEEDLPPDVPTDETDSRQILTAPVPLAFPLHTEAVRNWFAGRY